MRDSQPCVVGTGCQTHISQILCCCSSHSWLGLTDDLCRWPLAGAGSGTQWVVGVFCGISWKWTSYSGHILTDSFHFLVLLCERMRRNALVGALNLNKLFVRALLFLIAHFWWTKSVNRSHHDSQIVVLERIDPKVSVTLPVLHF